MSEAAGLCRMQIRSTGREHLLPCIVQMLVSTLSLSRFELGTSWFSVSCAACMAFGWKFAAIFYHIQVFCRMSTTVAVVEAGSPGPNNFANKMSLLERLQ